MTASSRSLENDVGEVHTGDQSAYLRVRGTDATDLTVSKTFCDLPITLIIGLGRSSLCKFSRVSAL